MPHLAMHSLELRITVPADAVADVSLKPLVSPHGPYAPSAVPNGVAATKAMPNGDTVTIRRVPSSDGTHEIIGTYAGTITDAETARFALYNMLFDLVDVGLLPPLQSARAA